MEVLLGNIMWCKFALTELNKRLLQACLFATRYGGQGLFVIFPPKIRLIQNMYWCKKVHVLAFGSQHEISFTLTYRVLVFCILHVVFVVLICVYSDLQKTIVAGRKVHVCYGISKQVLKAPYDLESICPNCN